MKNSNLTKRGIAYDLEKTPYSIKLDYGDNIIEYFFTSQLHLDKFMNNRRRQLEKYNKYIFNVLPLEGFDLTLPVDIKLYSKVETRGFLITDTLTNRSYKCLDTLKLDGQLKISKT